MVCTAVSRITGSTDRQMSYDMRFKGSFTYPDAATATRAVEQVRSHECIGDSVVTTDDLIVDGVTVRVDVDTSAPATMWEETCAVIGALSELAADGAVECVYDGGEGPDAVYRVRILPGDDEEDLD